MSRKKSENKSAAARRLLPPLDAPAQSLDSHTRQTYEPRFGHNFSKVRIHDNSIAAESAKSVGAAAYTVGNDIVFGRSQYKPSSRNGRNLLTHELAHVAQQSHSKISTRDQPTRLSNEPEEREAELTSSQVLSGKNVTIRQRSERPTLARFSDNNHHVIEEAALPAAGFTPEQIHSIERGNIQRDYSQIGAAGNAALLGQGQGFGGYKPEEHFDNFIFDAVTNRWRTRGPGQQKFLHIDPKEPDTSPIDYITVQLTELANKGMSEESLVHLGNAFHTVEDFFAHSNFMELAKKDLSFGSDLVTGSFDDDPANSTASLSHTLGAVSTPRMQSYYDQKADAAAQKTEPRSHSRIAKDSAAHPGFAEARKLAALVIQDLGADVIYALGNPKPEVRMKLMSDRVIAKIRSYLRPPNPKDPWWERLTSPDAGAIDRRLADADKRTAVTVNQAIFSPLRNMEASKNSPMGIPFGVAAPLGDNTWLQAGAGVTRPSAFDSRLQDAQSPADHRALPFLGAQITGRF